MGNFKVRKLSWDNFTEWRAHGWHPLLWALPDQGPLLVTVRNFEWTSGFLGEKWPKNGRHGPTTNDAGWKKKISLTGARPGPAWPTGTPAQGPLVVVLREIQPRSLFLGEKWPVRPQNPWRRGGRHMEKIQASQAHAAAYGISQGRHFQRSFQSKKVFFSKCND